MFDINQFVNFNLNGKTMYGVVEEILDVGQPVLYRVLDTMHNYHWLDANQIRENKKSDPAVNDLPNHPMIGKTVEFDDWDDETGERIVRRGVVVSAFDDTEDYRGAILAVHVAGRFMSYTENEYDCREVSFA